LSLFEHPCSKCGKLAKLNFFGTCKKCFTDPPPKKITSHIFDEISLNQLRVGDKK